MIGRKAGERAVRRLNPGKVATGRATVVYDPRVATSLVGHLSGAINGAAIARKTSFLRDKLGSRIFSATIQITDDPTRAARARLAPLRRRRRRRRSRST